MTKKINAERVATALNNMAAWRGKAKSQGATHLFPMLALLERQAGDPPGNAVLLNETPHEFEFWDKYFRVDDGNETKPYFNPVTLRRAEAGFPHSNSATIRKNTFAGKWHAAKRDATDRGEEWSLSEDYADIFREKVLTKGDQVSRAPVVDLAVLFFRNDDFPDDADAQFLEARFRAEFPQREEDFQKLFVFHPEDKETIFSDALQPQDYQSAILSVLIGDVKSTTDIPETLPETLTMDLDDVVLGQVQKLLAFGTSGIILTGVPGTGKSYYAKRIAKHLVQEPIDDIFRVQFHPSYGYEDFVEGYRPDEQALSGFKVVDKTFLIACERARRVLREKRLVIVIVDEINRGDPARVFGELLTYIERTYREEKFTLPFSGRPFSVPDNLVLLGTMNPYDRSVSQIDAAFVRRFDHIEISPSREVVEELLETNSELTQQQISEIGRWFEVAQKMLPFGLGHSFFAEIKNLEHLRLVWQYRMRPTAVNAVELNDGAMGSLTASFEALVRRLEGVATMAEIIECREFDEISIRVATLLQDGELRLDERIVTKGYLNVSMRGGQIALRATRFVGTIPLTPDLAVRITPRANISNLSYMLVRSGVIPSAISGFARGYMPRFVAATNSEKVFAKSLVDGVKHIAQKGYAKDYLPPSQPIPWRGRLLASDTVRRHASKGIRYRHEFEQSVLTSSTIENIALKTSLQQIIEWHLENDRKNPVIREVKSLLGGLWHVADWGGSRSDLVRQLAQKIHSLSPHRQHYRDPLWSAFLILQSALPELNFDGFVRLDSLIIDVSKVFEAYLRKELAERLDILGYEVFDGNKAPHPFFRDGGIYKVHPDIVIRREGKIVAVLDAKYKTEPKETDRYEVLSFMDATGVDLGGFICPADNIDTSRFLGTTVSGKQMSLFRYDLSVYDPVREADRFASNVVRMLEGSHDYR